MKLTTKGYYALQAILDIVNNGNERPVRLIDIHTRQELPQSYLEQIFRNLRKGDIVKSVRGPGGGYILSRPTTEISIAQVLSSVNELMRYSDSVDKPKKATAEHRQMARFFKGLDSVVLSILNDTSIDDIITGTITEK